MSASLTVAEGRERTVLVWDLVIRAFHWSLALAFAVAYLTEDGPLALHVWAGYLVGGLLVLRLVWGFVGPKHARFSDFLFGPFAALRYLVDLLQGRARRYLGHSPAGAAMVFALLVVLAGVVGSGLQLYAIEDKAGPLAGVTAAAPLPMPVASARAQEEDEGTEVGEAAREGAGDWWEETHELLANLALVLVILHIAGVVVASLAHRENLARAMVTGYKRAE
jgi:cytochrome b